MTDQPISTELVEAMARADWPITGRFRFYDEPGEHDPCYVIMPDGAMLVFNHHAGQGVDIARAEFVMNACNAALLPTPGPGGEDTLRNRLLAAQALFEKHTEAVWRFLGELYMVMVDPCAEGTMPVAQMKNELMAAALLQRDRLASPPQPPREENDEATFEAWREKLDIDPVNYAPRAGLRAAFLAGRRSIPPSQAVCDCENPEPSEGVALISEDCPIHGGTAERWS